MNDGTLTDVKIAIKLGAFKKAKVYPCKISVVRPFTKVNDW